MKMPERCLPPRSPSYDGDGDIRAFILKDRRGGHAKEGLVLKTGEDMGAPSVLDALILPHGPRRRERRRTPDLLLLHDQVMQCGIGTEVVLCEVEDLAAGPWSGWGGEVIPAIERVQKKCDDYDEDQDGQTKETEGAPAMRPHTPCLHLRNDEPS
jgi:hypothetical protein